MRIALISDIHGNNTALQAVLADIKEEQIDSIICLGDVLTLGPQPKEVLKTMRDLNCPCVMGNHDAALLKMELFNSLRIAPSLFPTVEWCQHLMTEDDLAFLQSFRDTITVTLGDNTTLLCFHGSPKSNIDIILANTPLEEVTRLFENETAMIMAGGHTHIQMLRQHQGKMLINAGSVGSAFLSPSSRHPTPVWLPWAEYAIVNWKKGVTSVDFRHVPYDLDVYRHVLEESDCPLVPWWLDFKADFDPPS